MNMKEVRQTARDRMKGFCRVCPVCDGRACAGEVPGMGGLGTGASFRNNVDALAAVKLNMRVIHDVKTPNTSVTILGKTLTIPVFAAPIGGVSFNMGGGITEDQYTKAIISGCVAEGILGCTGDGTADWIYESGLKAVKEVQAQGIPFIKPWASDELNTKIDNVASLGCKLFGMDIDAAGLITLALQGRPVSPMTPQELTTVVTRVHNAGMKFILKGIMGVQDAIFARDCGVDAIVVSNHGGRVLNHCPGTAEVLPAISAAVRGMTVLVDGGVRTGTDILKMLALGANAVLIGRPFSVAAVGGEEEGVRAYIQSLRSELTSALVLTGCASAQDAGAHLIYRG